MTNIRVNNLEVIRSPGLVTGNLALAVATVVFCINRSELNVLLTEKNSHASDARWALPGGGVQPGESLEEAACRTLQEETGIGMRIARQFQTFGHVDQYPGKRVVTVAFYALTRMPMAAGADATNWKCFCATTPPALEIGHQEILVKAVTDLRQMAILQPIGEDLLPDQFTMEELQTAYEAILQRKLDAVRFRRKMWSLNLLIPLQKVENKLRSGSTQMLYRFNVGTYHRHMETRFSLDL